MFQCLHVYVYKIVDISIVVICYDSDINIMGYDSRTPELYI